MICANLLRIAVSAQMYLNIKYKTPKNKGKTNILWQMKTSLFYILCMQTCVPCNITNVCVHAPHMFYRLICNVIQDKRSQLVFIFTGILIRQESRHVSLLLPPRKHMFSIWTHLQRPAKKKRQDRENQRQRLTYIVWRISVCWGSIKLA